MVIAEEKENGAWIDEYVVFLTDGWIGLDVTETYSIIRASTKIIHLRVVKSFLSINNRRNDIRIRANTSTQRIHDHNATQRVTDKHNRGIGAALRVLVCSSDH